MRKVLETAQKAAGADSTILITGETGTGKGRDRQADSRLERETGATLLPLELRVAAPTLVESELFGVRRGAFTDAKADRAGAFVAAEDGTLFLGRSRASFRWRSRPNSCTCSSRDWFARWEAPRKFPLEPGSSQLPIVRLRRCSLRGSSGRTCTTG